MAKTTTIIHFGFWIFAFWIAGVNKLRNERNRFLLHEIFLTLARDALKDFPRCNSEVNALINGWLSLFMLHGLSSLLAFDARQDCPMG